KARIIDGTFSGGQMLSESEVSTALGMSRTPVREAFLRLAAEGVLRLYPKRGALVISITNEDVRALMEARLLIEPWAVAIAAARPDRDQLASELLVHIDGMAEAAESDQPLTYQEADRAFHEAIVDVTENGLVADFYRSLRDRQLRVGAAALVGRDG